MKTTTYYGLKKPEASDYATPDAFNENADAVDQSLHVLDTGKAGAINNNEALSGAIADADYLPLYDTSAAAEKKTLWSTIKSTLKTYFDGLYAALIHTHTKSQITDFPTLGTAAAKDVPSSGNAGTTQVVMGSDTRLSDSRPASDVYPWAKAASKPSYMASDVGAIAASDKGASSGVASLDNNIKVIPAQASALIVSVADSKTLALTDAGTQQVINSSADVTVNVPLNSAVAFPVGTEIEIFRAGSGAVTVTFTSGVTVWCSKTAYAISDQYTSACLKKMATDTWALQGNVG